MGVDFIDTAYNSFLYNASLLPFDCFIHIYEDSKEEHQLLSLFDNETDNNSFYFDIRESSGRITLINSEFIVWITPNVESSLFIAKSSMKQPSLELVIQVRGKINTSKNLLKLVRFYLNEIVENNNLLTAFNYD